ncbi:MAG TPA: ChaB family protein [Thermomicrobiales bacterium]|nr:ChaB family protein [Thermomicrobiales bacterium]
MPYKAITALPDSVRDHLPKHAQEIYKDAFNSAWDEYGHEESRAHAVAWAAVKKSYHKGDDGDWHEGASKD